MLNWWITQKLAGFRRQDAIREVELDRLVWECEGRDVARTDPALSFGLVDALLSFAAFFLLAGIAGAPPV